MCVLCRCSRVLFVFAFCVLLGGLSSCSGIPGALVTVTVELVNDTDFDVEPRLFIDDDDSTFFVFNITTDENRIVTGLIPPRSTSVFTFRCERAGTMMCDHAEMFDPAFGVIVSDNAPIMREKDNFDCWDRVSFIFVDTGAEFFTAVEVNGLPADG